MRLIIACGTCNRQFDGSGRAIGSLFHCRCGDVLTVERPQGHEASVIRCASCGGARKPGQKACGYCHASFTIHERDLHTICPACLARISDKAAFCHHCGQSIHPEYTHDGSTQTPCPVCPEDALLSHRSLGDNAIPLLECIRCAGMWMGSEAFKSLEKVAAEEGRSTLAQAVANPSTGHNPLSQQGPMYRKCPECGEVMNRLNYGRISGVIIDVCKEHGVWFDAHELDTILRWVRQGGLEASAAKQQLRRAEELRRLKAEAQAEAAKARMSSTSYSGTTFDAHSTVAFGEALLDVALSTMSVLKRLF